MANTPPPKTGRTQYAIESHLEFDTANKGDETKEAVYKYVTQQAARLMKDAQGKLVQDLNKQGTFNYATTFNFKQEADASLARLQRDFKNIMEQRFKDMANQAGKSLEGYIGESVRGFDMDKVFQQTQRPGYGYKHYSVNPKTGPTMREMKAYLNAHDIDYTVSGQGETTRLSGVFNTTTMRKLSSIRNRVDKEIESGLYSKNSNIEAWYGTQDELNAFKLKRDNQINALKTGQPTPEMVEALDLKLLAKHDQKTLEKQRKRELGLTEGESTPKGATSRGERLAQSLKHFGSAGIGLLGIMKNALVSMVGMLKQITMDLGKLVQDSAELGINPNRVDEYRRIALAFPAITGGDQFALVNPLKTVQSRFGSWARLGNSLGDNLGTAGVFGKVNPIINGAIEAAASGDSERALNIMYSGLYSLSNKGDPKQHQRIMMSLQDVDSELAAGYNRWVWIGKHNVDASKQAAYFKEGYTAMVNPTYGLLDKTTYGATNTMGAFRLPGLDMERNVARSERAIGDWETIKNQFAMKLLDNIDIIVSILFTIAKGLANFYGLVTGDYSARDAMVERENKMGKEAFAQAEVSAAQVQQKSSSLISGYLSGKGVRKENLSAYTGMVRDEMQYMIANEGQFSDNFNNLPAEVQEALRNKKSNSLRTAYWLQNSLSGYYNDGARDTMKDAAQRGVFRSSGTVDKFLSLNLNKIKTNLMDAGYSLDDVDHSIDFRLQQDIEMQKVDKNAIHKRSMREGQGKPIRQGKNFAMEYIDKYAKNTFGREYDGSEGYVNSNSDLYLNYRYIDPVTRKEIPEKQARRLLGEFDDSLYRRDYTASIFNGAGANTFLNNEVSAAQQQNVQHYELRILVEDANGKVIQDIISSSADKNNPLFRSVFGTVTVPSR